MPKPARTFVAALAAVLGSAAPAHAAGDPIMPLSDVSEGMACTGYSVVRGTDIASFNVEIRDVVEDETIRGGKLILVRVSGPAIDATGLGPGFSGSPIYCNDSGGTPRVAGAISLGVGAFGNKVALATPIQQILDEPVDPPRATSRLPASARATIHPLAGPVTVAGLGAPGLATLRTAATKAGRTVLAAPPAPLRSFPPQTLRPGSAMAVGLTTGDVSFAALGTVAYVDGDRVWSFGHPLDQAGPRSLFLQDAYVYDVIDNPVGAAEISTYKLAAPGHTLGTLTNDGTYAVVGRTGPQPAQFQLDVGARDADSGGAGETSVTFADETDADQPLGESPLSIVGPLVIAQAASEQLRGVPARLSGSMCLSITIREAPQPLGFCNRYVSSGFADEFGFGGVPSRFAVDALDAFSLVDEFRFADLHVTGVRADTELSRGLAQAFMLRGSARKRVRPGRLIRVRLLVQRVRGERETVSFRVRVPRGLKPGARRLTLIGTPDDDEVDLAAELADELAPEEAEGDPRETGGDPGPRSIAELAARVAALHRFTGVRARFGRAGERRVLGDSALRISGRVAIPLRVLPRRR
jgi:hypothetical protein